MNQNKLLHLALALGGTALAFAFALSVEFGSLQTKLGIGDTANSDEGLNFSLSNADAHTKAPAINHFRTSGVYYCPTSATKDQIALSLAGYFGVSNGIIKKNTTWFDRYQSQYLAEQGVNIGRSLPGVYSQLTSTCNDPNSPRGVKLTGIAEYRPIMQGWKVFLNGYGFTNNENQIKFNGKRIASDGNGYGSGWFRGTNFGKQLYFWVPNLPSGTYKVSVTAGYDFGTTDEIDVTIYNPNYRAGQCYNPLGDGGCPTPTPSVTPTSSSAPSNSPLVSALPRGNCNTYTTQTSCLLGNPQCFVAPCPAVCEWKNNACRAAPKPTFSTLPFKTLNSPTCSGLSQNSCNANTNPICEWWDNACQLPSCGALAGRLGYSDGSKYEVGCFPNGKPDASWTFAGPTNDCGSTTLTANKVGCFWRSK